MMSKHVSCDVQMIYLHPDILHRYTRCIICTTHVLFASLCSSADAHGHSYTPLERRFCYAAGEIPLRLFYYPANSDVYFHGQKAAAGLSTIRCEFSPNLHAPPQPGHYGQGTDRSSCFTQATFTYRKSWRALLRSAEQHTTKRKLWDLVFVPEERMIPTV